MVIRQGDIFWVDFSPSKGSEPKGKRPALVVQSNIFNESNINTIIVLAITSNLKYEFLPGNVRLLKNESGVPKACVINVSQIRSIDRDFLFEKVGSLSKRKLAEVKEGLKLILNFEV